VEFLAALAAAWARAPASRRSLDALKSQITSFVPRKVTTAQRDQLFASIDAIKAENPC